MATRYHRPKNVLTLETATTVLELELVEWDVKFDAGQLARYRAYWVERLADPEFNFEVEARSFRKQRRRERA
jgi:hypothetical protein